jgi:hypothetical protein
MFFSCDVKFFLMVAQAFQPVQTELAGEEPAYRG